MPQTLGNSFEAKKSNTGGATYGSRRAGGRIVTQQALIDSDASPAPRKAIPMIYTKRALPTVMKRRAVETAATPIQTTRNAVAIPPINIPAEIEYNPADDSFCQVAEIATLDFSSVKKPKSQKRVKHQSDSSSEEEPIRLADLHLPKAPLKLAKSRATRKHAAKTLVEDSKPDATSPDIKNSVFVIPDKRDAFNSEDYSNLNSLAVETVSAIVSPSKYHICPVNPMCNRTVNRPFSPRLADIYDQYMVARQQSTASSKSLCVSLRDSFCRMHIAELDIIPLGLGKGYPEHIDFTLIKQRIHKRRNEISKLLDPLAKSKYRSRIADLFRELGPARAQASSTIMARLDQVSCGYYGWVYLSYSDWRRHCFRGAVGAVSRHICRTSPSAECAGLSAVCAGA